MVQGDRLYLSCREYLRFHPIVYKRHNNQKSDEGARNREPIAAAAACFKIPGSLTFNAAVLLTQSQIAVNRLRQTSGTYVLFYVRTCTFHAFVCAPELGKRTYIATQRRRFQIFTDRKVQPDE